MKIEYSNTLLILKDIYNALYSYNSEDIAIIKDYINNHTLNIGKKISDIITTFNANNNIVDIAIIFKKFIIVSFF